tara:strand:- start:911 stop:1048 length:138 start_codon:yes stop_codon:yes gene_type:complete
VLRLIDEVRVVVMGDGALKHLVNEVFFQPRMFAKPTMLALLCGGM